MDSYKIAYLTLLYMKSYYMRLGANTKRKANAFQELVKTIFQVHFYWE